MKLLEKQEKHLNKKVYNALCDIGVPDDSAQTIAAEAARYDDRFDSLERSMLAMQTEFRREMSEFRREMSESRKEMSEFRKEMSEFREEMKTTTVEMKIDLLWVKRIMMAILGFLSAVLIKSFF